MNKHIDDTRYVQWEDGMYVMLDDLECDYEKALVEDSLRDSRYFNPKRNFFTNHYEACLEAVEHEAQLSNAYPAFHIWTTRSIEE